MDGSSPLLVKEGEWVEINFRMLHRDKSYWGSDADEFEPRRWETIRPTWQFSPFSGGPRICPAMKLVYTECEYIVATLVREFSALENRDPTYDWIEERRLIFQSRNGTKVGLIQ
jgi:cytochrome P450